jgi:hypothetical protein
MMVVVSITKRPPTLRIYYILRVFFIQSKQKEETLITIKTSSAALPSIAPSCGVLLHTPQSSLLGALHLISCW